MYPSLCENRHATLMLTNFSLFKVVSIIIYYQLDKSFYVYLQLLYSSLFVVPVNLWTPLPEKRDKPDNYISSYYSLFSLKKLLLGEFKSGKIPLTTKNLDQESAKCLLSFKRIREAWCF